MVELTAWIGRYSALSGIVNAFEVTPATDADQLPVMDARPAPASVRPQLPSTRIPMLTDRDGVPEADRTLFDEIAEGRGSVRGPFALLLHSPALCRAVLDLSVYLRRDDYVPAATRELAVIATARERDCPYVWAAHAPAARKEGVPDAVIATVRDRGDLGGMTPGERDVVEYVRQLLGAHRVEQGLFDRMLAAHKLPGLVEITATIGHYVFVTTVLNAFEVSPSPGAEVLPLG
jgi:4-carboxymuconolactone decarboxylase